MPASSSTGFRIASFLVLLLVCGVTVSATRTECAECDRVVARAVKLLPKQPSRVVVLDSDTVTPSLRLKLNGTEGFVTTGDPTVYLNKQGSTFAQALRGPGVWDCALAVIIWHEMAHLDGGDESEAQRQEELLWQRFVVEGRVDSARGLNYLAVLRKREDKTRPDQR
jgi:hypothetical protein